MVKAIVKTQHQDFLDTEIREFEEKELDGMKLIGYNQAFQFMSDAKKIMQPKIYSDKPIGYLYIWNSFDEVRDFLELCCFGPQELGSFYCSWKPSEDREVSVEYLDGELVEGSEDFFPEDVLKIAYHDPNQFFEVNEIEPAYSGPEGVKASEVVFGDFWQESKFPYVGYVWFEENWDRIGSYTMAIAHISPLAEMKTVPDLKTYLNSDAAKKSVEARTEIVNLRKRQ